MAALKEPALPSIAVVMPCYNAEQFIAQAINSAIGQDYPNLEIIIVDDGSTDRTVEIVRSFGDRVILRIGEHRGACHARNRGMALARAEFVLFLDADDYLHGDYLRQLALAAGEDTDLVLGKTVTLEDGETGKAVSFDEHPHAHALLSSYLDRLLQTSGFLWRRSFVQLHGGWDETLPVYQDVELAIRLLLRRPRLAFAAAGGAYAVYRQHSSAARISDPRSRAKAQARLAVLQAYKNDILMVDDPAIRTNLAGCFYDAAVLAFAAGYFDIGRAAVRHAKSLGVRRFLQGSPKGNILVMLVGLEWKVRLAVLGYRVFRRRRRFPFNLISD